VDTIRIVTLLTLGVTFLAAYGVQFEVVSVIGERWNLKPTPGVHVPAGLAFAAGVSGILTALLP
jgi:hypothetical protein